MLMILIPKEKMRTEVKKLWQYHISVTVYSEPAIYNMLILFKKKHIIFFKHDNLNKYTYLTQMLTMIQVIWESSQKNLSVSLTYNYSKIQIYYKSQ